MLAPNPSPWTLDGTNTWVLGYAEGPVIVIDPGPDDATHRKAIRQVIADRPVLSIVLTHGHADHSEGARALADDVRTNIRAVDPHHRLGDEGLAPGDVIDVAGGCQILLTPGHTSDSACLVAREDSFLIAGDTVLGRGTAVVAWPDGHLGQYLDSLRRLRDLIGDIGYLLPGHGPALGDPGHVLDAYMAHRMVRLDEVRDCMATGCTTASDIVATVYADVPRDVWPAAELSVRAQMEYVRDNG